MRSLLAGIERWQFLVARVLAGSGLVLWAIEAFPAVRSWWSSLTWLVQ